MYWANILSPPVEAVNGKDVSAIRSFQYSGVGVAASVTTSFLLGAFILVKMYSLLLAEYKTSCSVSKPVTTGTTGASFLVRSFMYNSLPVVALAAAITRYF